MIGSKKRQGLTLLILVPLVIIAWHLAVAGARAMRFGKIVSELGSVGRFVGAPMFNHAGTKILFFQTTEHGYGVFLYDLAGRKRTLLFEQVQKGPGFGNMEENFLGWSPDDAHFAYGRANRGWEVVVCEGKTGATEAVLQMNYAIVGATWPSPQYLVVANSERRLLAIRQASGQWLRPLLFKCFRNGPPPTSQARIEGLSAYGADAVVWRQGEQIWRCNEDAALPTKMADRLALTKSLATATMDSGTANNGFTWYEVGYNAGNPQTGLPAAGTTFKSLSSPSHFYAMAPSYSTDNALLVDAEVFHATWTMESPRDYRRLSFLGAAGKGKSTIRYNIHHLDGPIDSGTIEVPDWFHGTNAAVVANGRTSPSRKVWEAVNSGYPRLYSIDIVLTNSGSPVLRVDFSYLEGGGHSAIFAVSGATNETFMPIKGTGYNADMVVEKTDSAVLSAAAGSAFAEVERAWLDRDKNESASAHGRLEIESRNGEPTGIWRHATGSDVPECLVPNVDKPFHYVKTCPVEEGVVTNAQGEKLTYYLMSPVGGGGGKKHPAILGVLGIQEMGYAWSANHEAFANSGAYFLSVDRDQRDFSKWSEDLMTAYEALFPRLQVDANKVYLFADSAGAQAVYELMETRSNAWRGAVLFSPSHFPKVSSVLKQRLFFDCGGADGDVARRAMRFQDEAARSGVPVTLQIHPGLGHVFRVPAGERERMWEALLFLGGG